MAVLRTPGSPSRRNPLFLATAVVALAALAAAPPADGLLNARHFPDIVAGHDFGDGFGIYDPGPPIVYCWALMYNYVGLLRGELYHAPPGRYFAGWASSVEVPVGFVGPPLPAPLGNCFGLTGPGQRFALDLVETDWGAAVWSRHVLGPTQVAVLADTWLAFEYCEAPAAFEGLPGLVLPPLLAFTASFAMCSPADMGWYEDYLVYPKCHAFTMVTAPGILAGEQPVLLLDSAHDEKLPPPPPPYGSCNALVRSGQSIGGTLAVPGFGKDYLVQSCLAAQLFDTATGTTMFDADSDHFVVGHNGALFAWATAPGPVGGPFFPNVSNLWPNHMAPSCDAALGEDWGVDQASGSPFD